MLERFIILLNIINLDRLFSLFRTFFIYNNEKPTQTRLCRIY